VDEFQDQLNPAMEALNAAYYDTAEGAKVFLKETIANFESYKFDQDTESLHKREVILNELYETYTKLYGGKQDFVYSEAKPGLLKKFAANPEPKRGAIGDYPKFVEEELKITKAEEKKALRGSEEEHTTYIDFLIEGEARWVAYKTGKDLELAKSAEATAAREKRAYEDAGKAILSYAQTAFTGMAEAMGASENEMFTINKMFAAARATVNVIEAATKAFAINPFLGIAVGGVGAAAVGAILAQQPPALAEGGIVNKPTLALIGERGPEAVVPLKGGEGLGGDTIIMNIYGTVSSENQLAGFVANVQARKSRGY